MPLLHNAPHSVEVMHVNVQNGTFAGTVTKTFTGYAGQYQLCVAYNTDAVSAASTVQVQPYADEAQSAVGTAFDFKAAGGTFDGTVTIGTGTNAEIERTATDVFMPFGCKVTFSTTQGGSGTIDFFARLEA